MKTHFSKPLFGGALALLLGASLTVQAQQRPGGFGGGGGGFGGFGGFGGGGGGGFNRGGASATSSSYNNNGTVGSAVISVDPVTHNIIVVADKATREQIQRVIESLDAPEPQVLIKVAFVEVQDNKAQDIGFQGAYTGNPLGSLGAITGVVTNGYTQEAATSGQPAANLPNLSPSLQSINVGQDYGLPQSLAGAAGNGGMYQLLGNDFTATIQAIATADKAEVLSRPSILARDGQMAEIVVGQSIYLPSGVSFSSVGGTGATIPTINGSYQNVGIQLDVTPFIGANRLIQMILQPQITSIDNSTPGQVIAGGSLISSAVYAPYINKRSANTVVVTPDAQPVVIGGLISNNKSSGSSKVPFLGDIPLLGKLFSFNSKSDAKTELLIFLTPHIVSLPSQLDAMSKRETLQTPMITNTNSFSEKELDRVLERLPVKETK